MESPEFYLMASALTFKYGFFIGFTSWQTVIRLVMVFVNSKIKELVENSLPADRVWIENILASRKWRIAMFLVNALTSLKLPEVARKGLSPYESQTATIKNLIVKEGP